MTTPSAVLFDDSIPRLAHVIRQTLGDDAFSGGVILRDAGGRLSFISSRPPASEDERQQAALALSEALGAYARPDRVLAFEGDSGTGQLLSDPSGFPLQVGDIFCQVLDRRIVGAGWLDAPVGAASAPPHRIRQS